MENSLLLYLKEHLTCSNYISESKIGFKILQIKAGEFFLTKEEAMQNVLLFFLEGEVEIKYNGQAKSRAQKNQLAFISKMEEVSCQAIVDTKLVIHFFEAPLSLCDKAALQSLEPFCADLPPQRFFLDIRTPLDDFLKLLNFYIEQGMFCVHMHEIKQKELFLILRAFYTKEENASLLRPIIGKNMDFRNLVMEKYLQAKTVQGLAAACNCSLTSFGRFFKEDFDDSPYNWMQQQKTKQIVVRLADKNVTFSEIIDEFEFSSPAHFTTFCKKHLKTTPSQYRKKIIAEQDKRLFDKYKL